MTIYEHIEILARVTKGKPFSSLYETLLMGSQRLSDTETIGFDVEAEDMRIAPLVHPDAVGQVVTRQGYETVTLKPAYTKPKRVIRFNDLQSREIGYGINQRRSNAERYASTMVKEATYLHDRIKKLQGYMLSQLVKTGKVDIVSGEYGNYILDFQRPAGNTAARTSTGVWSHASTDAVDDLEDFINTLGKPIQAAVFGPTAWKNYRASAKFEKLVDVNYKSLSGTDALEFGPIQMGEERDWVYLGMHNSSGVKLFMDKTFVKVGSSDVPMVDADSVACIPAKSYGVWGYGPIQDVAASFTAYPMFFKNYETIDPGLPFIQVHSAPVPFHTAIEGIGYLKTEL